MMLRTITLILVVSVFCSPLIASAYAGQIQSQQFSQEEAEAMAVMEADSASEVAAIEAGDDVHIALIVLAVVVGLVVVNL